MQQEEKFVLLITQKAFLHFAVCIKNSLREIFMYQTFVRCGIICPRRGGAHLYVLSFNEQSMLFS